MKFRLHRGGLAESMETTVEIGDSFADLKKHLLEEYGREEWMLPLREKIERESIELVPRPDLRGWPDQQMVVYGSGIGVLGYIDRPLEQFYPRLAKRYRGFCLAALDGHAPINEALPAENQPSHLMWMIEQMCYLPEKDQSLTKKHRWLGFIQNACICHGWTTVQIERDHTRHIFNGA